MIYATQGLVETLLRMAGDADPESVTIAVAVTPAEELSGADLEPGTPVFTHFYMPSAGNSVSEVFGFDLGTPVAQSNGLFVSHPAGRLDVTKEDDLHEVVFVAVPLPEVPLSGATGVANCVGWDSLGTNTANGL